MLRLTLQSNQSSMCGLHRSGDRGEGGPNGQIVSVKRTDDARRQRSRILLMRREKSTGPRTDPCETPRRTRKNDFCNFDRPHKRAYQKGKIESNEQSKEGGQPK